ncbi:serine protease [Kovacikia minuta CCNUW1]|uniref:S1C family serine protease n=1 Tax=Kovacikia minuta TaxID=2931930 RepID=UPI001CCE5A4D|nr:serine protease [Kovacikia minuta]UBF25881.1 serine protease [Kovacikia minuta CCNUW1]
MKLRYWFLCIACLGLVLTAPALKASTKVLTQLVGQDQPGAETGEQSQFISQKAIPQKSEQQIANEVFQRTNPGVVTIYSGREIGSGIILSPNGLILTNKHVVWSSPQLEVKTANGKIYSGWVTALDLQFDLALVQLETKERLPTVRMANGVNMQPGQRVYAIGSPAGQAGTFTTGTFTRITSHGSIQTSPGLLEPGNSGGPLLNAQGEMIGVNKGLLRDGSGLATRVEAVKSFLRRNNRIVGAQF